VGRQNKRGGGQRAIHLSEIGPRLKLRLLKIEEGVVDEGGKVLYHHSMSWVDLRIVEITLDSFSSSEIG
jgi:hypothetical protein